MKKLFSKTLALLLTLCVIASSLVFASALSVSAETVAGTGGSWDFSGTDVAAATEGLETYVNDGTGTYAKVENTDEWSLATNTACVGDDTAIISNDTGSTKYRGYLLTEGSYTDFEMTITAQGSRPGGWNHGYPRILFGVTDPTKSFDTDAAGGFCLYFHGDTIGRVKGQGVMATAAGLGDITGVAENYDSSTSGHYYTSGNIIEHTIKVSEKALTVSVKYVGNDDKAVFTASNTVTLPDAYVGGQIGLSYCTAPGEAYIYNMDVTVPDAPAPTVVTEGTKTTWNFSGSDVAAATASLESYIYEETLGINYEVENTEEWKLVANDTVKDDYTAITSTMNDAVRKRGALVTEESYTDFEMTLTATNARPGGWNHGYTKLLIGVQDPTADYATNADGGIAIDFFGDVQGKLHWEGQILTDEGISNWITTSAAEGFDKSTDVHYYATAQINKYTVKVSGNQITVSVEYVGNDEKSVYTASNTVTLPEAYEGGRVGFTYSTDNGTSCIYNMSVDTGETADEPVVEEDPVVIDGDTTTWKFSGSDVAAATAGLDTYVANAKVENTTEWQLGTNSDCPTDSDYIVSTTTSYARQRGMLLTNRNYTDFELEIIANGANNGSSDIHGYPRIMLGVTDPTKAYTSDAAGGLGIYFFQGAQGKLVWEGQMLTNAGITNVWLTTSAADGYIGNTGTDGNHHFAGTNVIKYIVKVSGKQLTVSVVYAGTKENSFTATVTATLPDAYAGGRVGIGYPSNTDQGQIYSMKVTDTVVSIDAVNAENAAVKLPAGKYTDASALSLPTSVTVADADGNEYSANVEWNTEALLEGGKLMLNINETVTVTGTVIAGANADGVIIAPAEGLTVSCDITGFDGGVWNFEGSDVSAVLEGLETYVGFTKVDNTSEWSLATGTDCPSDSSYIVSTNAADAQQRGTLLTEESYTDFEMTITAQGAIASGHKGMPRILLGVTDPTKSYKEDAAGGIAVYFFADSQGRIAWEGTGLSNAGFIASSKADGFDQSVHYYAAANITKYTLKVSGKTLTISVDYVGSNEAVYTQTVTTTLPDSYAGGKVGICYSTGADGAGKIFNMAVEDTTDIETGDVNGDGEIDIRDLVLLKKYTVGMEVIINYTAADAAAAEESITIDANDTTAIRKLLIG